MEQILSIFLNNSMPHKLHTQLLWIPVFADNIMTDKFLSCEKELFQEYLENDAKNAKHRNDNILKKLDIVKAKLLSKAIYSPMDETRAKAIQRYKMEPSLLSVPQKN